MAFISLPLSLFSEGPTAEHIEYALPTPGSTTGTGTSTNTTYHHIQHFLPDGNPGASSTHIEYADQYNSSYSSCSVFSEATLPFIASRRSTITTTPPRREQGTEHPSTSSPTSTSTSASTSSSPPLHVRFAGDLPLPLWPSSSSPPLSSTSPSTSQATRSRSEGRRTSTSTSTSRTRPRLSRNRASSPYPFVLDATHTRGGGETEAPDVSGEDFGRTLAGSREGRGDGDEAAFSTYANATTFARTAFVDREEVWDESGFLFEDEE